MTSESLKKTETTEKGRREKQQGGSCYVIVLVREEILQKIGFSIPLTITNHN